MYLQFIDRQVAIFVSIVGFNTNGGKIVYFAYSFNFRNYFYCLSMSNEWYFVIKIVLTYCEKKMF